MKKKKEKPHSSPRWEPQQSSSMEGIIHQQHAGVTQHNDDWLQSLLLGLCAGWEQLKEKPFRPRKCFYMISIEIHSSVVRSADTSLFFFLRKDKTCSYCSESRGLNSELRMCSSLLPRKRIDVKHYRFHLSRSPPILKQRTAANISSMLSAPASPAMTRGRLLKNDSSRACHRLVLRYLFSQWITKRTFSHLPPVHCWVV